MLYKYNSKKPSRRYHIVYEPTGLTYCKLENGSTRANTVTDKIPPKREACSVCLRLLKEGVKPTKQKKSNKIKESISDFYKSKAWADLRFQILKDADRCLCCGATKKEARLTVDHILPLWKYPKLRLEPSNMQVLCMLCNKGKGGKDETNFKEPDEVEEINEQLDREHLTNVVKLYE